MNEYGTKLKLSVFGESHAEKIGVTLTGFPAGFAVDMPQLQAFLNRRTPADAIWATTRREKDVPVFLGGLTDTVTNGEAITAVIYNTDVQPQAYQTDIPRPGHADFPAYFKYGKLPPGGGKYSGRMTAPLCIAGGLCLQYLQARGICVGAHILSIADVCDERFDTLAPQLGRLSGKNFPVLDDVRGEKMVEKIRIAREESDSVGGVIECAVTGLPIGLGEHMFDGMESRLSTLLFAIPAVKGVSFGSGFDGAQLRGSQNNDGYYMDGNTIRTQTNHHGGILGGMTTGMPLLFEAAVKPTPSIGKPQRSVSLSRKTDVELRITGRHDACIVPRAVPVVEAAAAIAVVDALLEEEKRHEAG